MKSPCSHLQGSRKLDDLIPPPILLVQRVPCNGQGLLCILNHNGPGAAAQGMYQSILHGQCRKHSWAEMLPAEHVKVSSPKPLVVPESNKSLFVGTSLPDPHNLPEICALEIYLYCESKQMVHVQG